MSIVKDWCKGNNNVLLSWGIDGLLKADVQIWVLLLLNEQ